MPRHDVSAPSPRSDASRDGDLGAYGLRLRGVSEASALLVEPRPEWPAYEVRTRIGMAATPIEHVSDRHAELKLRNGGQIEIDRARGDVLVTAPHGLRAEELVHPYLAPAAGVIARWLGRDSFHAGAVVLGDGSWGIVGEREAGKSSTLAYLALRGHEIVCDDMLILEGDTPLFGPRSVDLRAGAAAHLGVGKCLGVVGARERWRYVLGQPNGSSPPLRGWIFLEWGDEVGLRKVDGAKRFARLVSHQGVRLPTTNPAGLLGLASLPAWELRRPHRWESLDETVEALSGLAGH